MTKGCKWIVVDGRIEVGKQFKLACLNRIQNGSKLTCLIVVKFF